MYEGKNKNKIWFGENGKTLGNASSSARQTKSWNEFRYLIQEGFSEGGCDILVVESFLSALDGRQHLYFYLLHPIYYIRCLPDGFWCSNSKCGAGWRVKGWGFGLEAREVSALEPY
jgi:hypothetical protein